MLLQRLRLHNFLIFDEVDLDLRDVKLASIIGQHVVDRRRSNGSGKSALVESIYYALFDQTRSKSKLGIVRTGQKQCNVELEFRVGAHDIRVNRTRSSDGTSSAKIWVDGRLAGDKIKTVNDVIEQRLGIDGDLFQLIYFFKQNDQFGFAEANPSDRKNVLAKVFKMDALAKCQELAKERRKDAEASVLRAQGACEALRSRLSALPSYQQLQEQVLATSANLACALQIQHDYAEIGDITDQSLNDFGKSYDEFKLEADKDRIDIERLSAEITKHSNAIARLQASTQSDTAQMQQLVQRIQTLEKKQKESEDVGKLTLEIRDIEFKITEINNAIAVSKAEIVRLGQSKVHQVVGHECPTCGQFVGPDHAEKFLKQTQDAKTDHNRRIVELSQKSVSLNKFLFDLKIRKDNALENTGLVGQIKAAEETLKVYKSKLKEYKQQIDSIDILRTQAIQQHSEACSRSSADFANNIKGRVDWLSGRFSKLLAVHLSRKQEVSISNTSVLQFQCNNAEKSLAEREKLTIDVESAEDKVKRYESDLKVYEYLVEVFGKNGIQAIVIENAIGIIESFANEILRQMQTRFIVSLRTQKETKAGELRESLDVIVYDNGSEKPFENYSGGERTLINLALRLALSRVIGSLHGVQMHSLFLDEVLAPLDEVNREEAVKVVAFLARSFEQIFIISHTDEIKDIIDSCILIERHDEHSRIVLTNNQTKEP